jgi:cytochrome c oxidase accessory protein FixG
VVWVRRSPVQHPTSFGIMALVTGAVLFDFMFFREQTCMVACPYGRVQSVLLDKQSLIVAYDNVRGEPRMRGKVRPPSAGDCVDCNACVATCPTGIDIRDGLQMECLACAQCADACDEVMLKLHRPAGLVRYASLNQLAGRPRRVWRPRLVVYAAAAFLAVSAAAVALGARTTFEATIVRQPGVPWVTDADGVRNQLEVHLTNKRGTPARFRLAVTAPVPARIAIGQSVVDLPAMGDVRVPLVITIAAANLRPGLLLELQVADDQQAVLRQEIRFIAPVH